MNRKGWFLLWMMGISFLGSQQVPLPSEESALHLEGTLSWESSSITARAVLSLRQRGITLPAGRIEAMEVVHREFPAAIRPFILNLQAHSMNRIGDLLTEGLLSLEILDRLIESATIQSSTINFSRDEFVVTYTLSFNTLRAAIIQHGSPRSLPLPLRGVASRPSTGIIIIATDPLPVHGKQESHLLIPCLFPRIWDTSMNLVYEKSMVEPTIARERGIVLYSTQKKILQNTPSGMDPSLIPLVGERPLRILAEGVFGIQPTDPIINREDALRILSHPQNRELLRQGRVIFIIANTLLEQGFSR